MIFLQSVWCLKEPELVADLSLLAIHDCVCVCCRGRFKCDIWTEAAVEIWKKSDQSHPWNDTHQLTHTQRCSLHWSICSVIGGDVLMWGESAGGSDWLRETNTFMGKKRNLVFSLMLFTAPCYSPTSLIRLMLTLLTPSCRTNHVTRKTRRVGLIDI